MCFENVHDLEAIRDIAKEDDIAFAGEAPHIEAELGARAAVRALQSGEFMAFCPKPPHEIFVYRHASAGVGDISENIEKVGAVGRRRGRSAEVGRRWWARLLRARNQEAERGARNCAIRITVIP